MKLNFFCICFLSVFLNISIYATEAIHDNLPAFDSSVKEFTMLRPTLFGRSLRKAYVRRDKINTQDQNGQRLDVGVSFLSGTGKSIFHEEEANEDIARASLDRTDFESVSGKTRDNLSASPFKADSRVSFVNGIDINASISLAQIARDIYLKFPLASKAFANAGFKEQRFVVGIKSASKGVVLKNKEAIVIAFRGTEPTSVTNWMTNIKFFQVPLLEGTSPEAHLGFYQALTELWPLVRAEIVSSFENKIRKRIQKLSQQLDAEFVLATYGIQGPVSPPDERPLYLTGHSLGGAEAVLLFGELTYNKLDYSQLGYYFVDPTLRKLSDDQVNKLISDTIYEESFGFDSSVERTFSFNEQADFERIHDLSGLAVIQNEAHKSLMPVADRLDVTIDRRLRKLYTFGAPRAGNWMFKNYLEKYASTTGAQVIRFENFHKEAAFIGNILQADLVPRIPSGSTSLADYAHVGTRASFETDNEDTQGNAAWLKCEYTNIENERTIANFFDGDIANIKFSFDFHKMDLYLKRVRSYGLAQSLDSNHSCNKLKYEALPL